MDRFIQKLEKKYGKDYEESYKSVGNSNVSNREYTSKEFTLDGKKYTQNEYSSLGVAIIRKYIGVHNNLTFEELSQMLDDARILKNTKNGTHVLMTPEMIKENESYERTYLKETDTYAGQEFYIFKSWGPKCIQDVVDFAIEEGFMEDTESVSDNATEVDTYNEAEDGSNNDAVE